MRSSRTSRPVLGAAPEATPVRQSRTSSPRHSSLLRLAVRHRPRRLRRRHQHVRPGRSRRSAADRRGRSLFIVALHSTLRPSSAFAARSVCIAAISGTHRVTWPTAAVGRLLASTLGASDQVRPATDNPPSLARLPSTCSATMPHRHVLTGAALRPSPGELERSPDQRGPPRLALIAIEKPARSELQGSDNRRRSVPCPRSSACLP